METCSGDQDCAVVRPCRPFLIFSPPFVDTSCYTRDLIYLKGEGNSLPDESKAPANLYEATRVSSGNFNIVKPKRNKKKLRQLRLKSPNSGMRR